MYRAYKAFLVINFILMFGAVCLIVKAIYANGESKLSICSETSSGSKEAVEITQVDCVIEHNAANNIVTASELSMQTSQVELAKTEFREEAMSEAEQRVYDFYCRIPTQIRTQFEASDWKYRIYEDDALCNLFGYSTEIMGITVWNYHEIIIDRRESSAGSIVHEIGHWMSRYYNGGVNGTEFTHVFERDWRVLHEEFGGSVKNYDTPDEFVAEAFSLYVLSPAELQMVAPETYEFIDSFVNSSY